MRFHSVTEPADLLALIDDHHLVVASHEADMRARFSDRFIGYLKDVVDGELILIDGAAVRDAGSLAARFAWKAGRGGGLTGESFFYPQAREIEAVVERLKRPTRRRRRVVVWTDAHVLLEADPHLFTWLVNAITSIAIEGEHLGPEDLVLLRAVFIGSEALAGFARDDHGPFQQWQELERTLEPRMVSWDDPPAGLAGAGDDGFWEAASCVDRPPVRLLMLD